MFNLKVSSFRPSPPVLGKVTHSTIELFWDHVKEKLVPNQRYRYTVQEMASTNRREWSTVYS